jgi:Zn-dependent peptidase ImmA (M78 family)
MMEISEATAIIRARAFIKQCEIASIPVDVNRCAKAANAEIRLSDNLPPGESGNTVFVKDRHLIFVNSREKPERIRFTIFHELAHIVLDLPSQHGGGDTNPNLYNYSRRPREEVICDIFAAECLLPWAFLTRDLETARPGLDFVISMAEKYEASLSCAASRVTEAAPFACSYVLSQDSFIRFSTSSASMRAMRFWISPGIAVPAASVTNACITSMQPRLTGTTAGYVWTSRDEFLDISLNEEVILLQAWNQGLTLIWPDAIDEADFRETKKSRADDDEPPLLSELTGQLPWPGRKRRR